MFWTVIGIGLLLWVLYDLYTGEVWSYRAIKRKEEPGQYWLWTAIWFVIALTVLYPSLQYFSGSPYTYVEDGEEATSLETTATESPEPVTTPEETALIEPDGQETDSCVVLEDFTGTSGLRWGTVNDGVMGGLSSGTTVILDEKLIHTGTINTNGGGFSYTGTRLTEDALVGYNSLKVLLNTNGRSYDVNFNDARYWRINHQTPVPTTRDSWQEVTIHFSDTIPTIFSRPVESEPFAAAAISELNFILSDGIDGPFRMEIDWIKVCS
ncbi:MAG: CIA30 family protein [Patescibacteria group bacterium]